MKMPSLVLAATGLACAAPAYGAASPATRDQIAFFVGEWGTGPAPVEGYETIPAVTPDCRHTVRIAPGGDTQITRTARTRDGQQVSANFRVVRVGNTYPWWPVDGGIGPVARTIDAESFDLAPMVMGRADWARAIRHHRCPATPGPATPERNAEQP